MQRNEYSDKLGRLLNPICIVRHLWQHREMIWQFGRREVEGRYRGSFLGLLWSFVNPLVLLSTYTFVFGVVFRSRWQGSHVSSLGEYALVLFCGLIAFNVFSECMCRSPSLIVAVPNYVKKVVFPLEVLPVSVLGAALFQSLISLLVLLAGILIINGHIPYSLVFLPLAALPLLLLSLGLMWFLAGLGVFVRDIHHTVGLVVQVLIFITPVFYSLEIIPEPFRTIIRFNPLTSIVENFRRNVLWGLPLVWQSWTVWLAVSFLVMLFGYAWFMRTKRGFADVI